jgi:predicted aminopeptidase
MLTYHRTIEKRRVIIQESMHRRMSEIENEPRALSQLTIQWITTATGQLMAGCEAIGWYRVIVTTEETTAG